MTPAERVALAKAVAANHPSVCRSQFSDAASPAGRASEAEGGVTAVTDPSAPPTLQGLDGIQSSIESLADRLRLLKGGRT